VSPFDNQGGNNFGLTNSSIVWSYAGVILVALIILALLRMFFASFRVEGGVK
jgi:hypothetical protein